MRRRAAVLRAYTLLVTAIGDFCRQFCIDCEPVSGAHLSSILASLIWKEIAWGNSSVDAVLLTIEHRIGILWFILGPRDHRDHRPF
ncbi:hypothetical protein BS47DRAFT_370941 [Hydnum rufescens UP504]|uniref:Secreted protein n=1 Tax=Hydnum rufescens UP504 TaxID=1448309 RepID=A0A9P6B682_9AGAM|nr:hypothetical protein BS47DRAFT_370941 [Hydnum rufescens UP504]